MVIKFNLKGSYVQCFVLKTYNVVQKRSLVSHTRYNASIKYLTANF